MTNLTDKQLELLEWAKYYASHGISVIPVGKDKKPLILWKDYQERIATVEEIEAWWDKYPDAQVGGVTGEISNLTVVDVEAGGDWDFLPQNTAVSKTGSGGRHYFYTFYPIANKVRIRPLVDFRSKGGYCILAPSTSEKGSYEWLQRVPLLQFPIELFADDLKSEGKIDMSGVSSLKMTSDAFMTTLEKYDGHEKGSRNSELTSLAGYLMNRIHPLNWEAEVLPALHEANKKNTPPLSEYEVSGIYRSIVATDLHNPTSRWILKEKEIKETPVDNAGEEDDIRLMSEVAKLETININKFFPLGISLFDQEIGGGLIPGDLMIIAAFPSHGKTSFAQFLTRNFLLSGQKVLFLSYEVLVQHVWEKFKGMGLEEDSFIYAPLKIQGAMDWVDKIIRKAKREYGTEIVVIDHLGFLMPKTKGGFSKLSENYSIYLTGIVRDLKTLAREEELSVILPVHLRKRSGYVRKNTPVDMNEIAHTGGISQEADLVFLMQREERSDQTSELFTGYSSITLGKNRRGKRNPRGYFTLIDDIFVHEEGYVGEGKIAESQGYDKKKVYTGGFESKDLNVDDRTSAEIDDLIKSSFSRT